MPSSRPPLSKAERIAIIGCVLVVLPVIAVFALFSGRDADPVWNIPTAAPRPKPNGFDDYMAAAAATVHFKPEVDPASDVHYQPPGSAYALQNYSVARREQWLQANARTFALVQQGLKTPSMTPDTEGTFPLPWDWGKLRQLGRDMSARTRTLQMEGRPGAATMSALDTLQMGQDTTRGGASIARLVGIAIMVMGRTPLDDWDKTINALSATEARAAARRLEAILAREPSAVETLTNSKRISLIQIRQLLETAGWRGPLKPRSSEEGVLQVWERQTTSKRAVYDHVVRSEDANIAWAKQPYSKAKNPTPATPLDMFSRDWDLTSVSNIMVRNNARSATSNNMLLMRLALRAYIAEHGQAPAALSALVPTYLKSVPTDIYNDGKPLFYTPQGRTYKLWSIGPDGVNNNGTPFPSRTSGKPVWPVQNTMEGTGDFVAGQCR